MTLWLALSVLLRGLMTLGTLYVAQQLWRLHRDAPAMIRTLDGKDPAHNAAAKTLEAFQEHHLLTIGIAFQIVSLTLLWMGLLVDYGLFNTVTTWVSMTLAAGGTPVILSRNVRIWYRDLRDIEEARHRILSVLEDAAATSYTGFYDPLRKAMGQSRAAIAIPEAIRTLEEDGLITRTSDRGPGSAWLQLTEHGQALNQLGGLAQRSRKDTLKAN